jgi:hypothetical protein
MKKAYRQVNCPAKWSGPQIPDGELEAPAGLEKEPLHPNDRRACCASVVRRAAVDHECSASAVRRAANDERKMKGSKPFACRIMV